MASPSDRRQLCVFCFKIFKGDAPFREFVDNDFVEGLKLKIVAGGKNQLLFFLRDFPRNALEVEAAGELLASHKECVIELGHIDFKNTIIIMTSNIGSPLLIEGLNPKGEITEKARQAVMAELRKHFRPEFLNRVDEIVLFKPLTLEEIKKIVDLLLDLLRLRLAEKRITLTLTDAAREHIGREGYDPIYGARPLKRYLQREVETRLSRKLLAGEVLDGSALTLDAKNGSLEIRIGK